MRKILFLIAVLICTIRIVNYGIYTIYDKNTAGGIGLFALSLLTVLSSVYILVN